MSPRKTTRRTGNASPAKKGRSVAGDTLGPYRKKRNFKKTSEPQGGRTRPGGPTPPAFVVQRHDASHLHYDLRLEEKGVLKSWAIPKTPPEVEGLKRLAVETEDHPLDYQNFEGIIPEGEYGAGRVEIWDKGRYLPLEQTPAKRLFRLSGRKLNGTFALIKLKPGDKKDKNWLFFKTRTTEGR
jgi:DNA ligase D-like protein (predicted 3'-phosphoesterase)